MRVLLYSISMLAVSLFNLYIYFPVNEKPYDGMRGISYEATCYAIKNVIIH